MSIVIRDVHYTHRAGTPLAVPALAGVTLEIARGSLTALVGRTGSGKSTLAEIVAGLLRPGRGTLHIDGVDVYGEPGGLAAVRRHVGIAFQYAEAQLFGATVFEDVAFGPRQSGLHKSEVERRVYAALGRVGLTGEAARRSPFELSGGQRRRVALAGVLATEPRVLVLDEPTAGLDGRGRRELAQLVVELHRQEGTTVVWVTHSMEEAARLADRVAVLAEGRVAMDGTPEDVFSDADTLRSLGLSAPIQVELLRRLRDAGLDVPRFVRSPEEAAEALARAWEARR